jgi:hypothetical protein
MRLQSLLFAFGYFMRKHQTNVCLVVILAAATTASLHAQGVVLITPVSATASTQYSSSYLINFTIDGSGLPANFTTDDLHANYTTNNHWTTSIGDIAGAFADYDLGTDKSLTHLYLWNHRSNSPPAFSTGYAVTQFDLSFYDANSILISTLSNLTAVGGTAAAQTFSFDQVDFVRKVRLTIDSNNGDNQVTGLAEVRFGYTAIPEPSTALLLVTGCLVAGTTAWRKYRRNRRD